MKPFILTFLYLCNYIAFGSSVAQHYQDTYKRGLRCKTCPIRVLVVLSPIDRHTHKVKILTDSKSMSCSNLHFCVRCDHAFVSAFLLYRTRKVILVLWWLDGLESQRVKRVYQVPGTEEVFLDNQEIQDTAHFSTIA